MPIFRLTLLAKIWKWCSAIVREEQNPLVLPVLVVASPGVQERWRCSTDLGEGLQCPEVSDTIPFHKHTHIRRAEVPPHFQTQLSEPGVWPERSATNFWARFISFTDNFIWRSALGCLFVGSTCNGHYMNSLWLVNCTHHTEALILNTTCTLLALQRSHQHPTLEAPSFCTGKCERKRNFTWRLTYRASELHVDWYITNHRSVLPVLPWI